MSERPSYLPEIAAQFERTEFVPTDADGDVRQSPDVAQLPDPERGKLDEHRAQLQTAEEAREQARVSLTGRVGAPVAFRVTQSGVPIARFPLAVRDEQERTTWHTIVAFRQRAERARDQVAKGAAVEIIGYEHEREARGKDGRARTVKEIYATVIKTQ